MLSTCLIALEEIRYVSFVYSDDWLVALRTCSNAIAWSSVKLRLSGREAPSLRAIATWSERRGCAFFSRFISICQIQLIVLV